jgi:hypothetical protein
LKERKKPCKRKFAKTILLISQNTSERRKKQVSTIKKDQGFPTNTQIRRKLLKGVQIKALNMDKRRDFFLRLNKHQRKSQKMSLRALHKRLRRRLVQSGREKIEIRGITNLRREIAKLEVMVDLKKIFIRE